MATPDTDPKAEFAVAIRRAGLILDGEPVMDGQLHRLAVVDGKPRAKDGTYVGFLDGRPAGFIQNFRSGTRETWTTEGKELTPEERAHLASHAQLAKLQRAADLSVQHQTAAEKVQAKWDRLPETPAKGENAYLARKGVPAYGVRFNGDKLVVPARDADGKLWSLQTIAAEDGGPKLFEKGGRKTGNFHLIGEPKPGEALLVAEGYATGASLHQASGQPVAIAFDSGNLDSVVGTLKKRFPESPIYVMGDDDHRQQVNVGVDKALAAARKHGVGVALPEFQVKHGLSDFNDLHGAEGLAQVKAQVDKTVGQTMAQTREQATERFAEPQISAKPQSTQDLPRSADAPLAPEVGQATRPVQVEPIPDQARVGAPQASEQSAQPGAQLPSNDSPARAPTAAADTSATPPPLPREQPAVVVPAPSQDAVARVVGADELERMAQQPAIADLALQASIAHRNSDAMAVPRNAVSPEEARSWVALDVADLRQIKADGDRAEAMFAVGQNAQEQRHYKAELSQQDPALAALAAKAYMEVSLEEIRAPGGQGRLLAYEPFEFAQMQIRHDQARQDGLTAKLLPDERADTLARDDVLTLQRLRGTASEPAAYALIGEGFKNEVYRETFNREMSAQLLPDDQSQRYGGEQRDIQRKAVEEQDGARRQSVERRHLDLETVPPDGIGPTVARDLARVDLDTLRSTQEPYRRLEIAELMGATAQRQASYKVELVRQDPEIAKSLEQLQLSGRDAYDVMKTDRPHVREAVRTEPTAPDDWALPLINRGIFASERPRPLTPSNHTAETFIETLHRNERPVWDNKEFFVNTTPPLVGDFKSSYREPAWALARSRGLLLEDDPVARYVRQQPPLPERAPRVADAAEPAQVPGNAIDQRSREQFYDDAATAALRKRIAQSNEAQLNDPARHGPAGDRALETIGRMTRDELEAFAQAAKQSPQQVQSVLAAAQKRIEGDVELRTGREPVPPLHERYNVVPHLGSREYLFRDKPGTAFTEGWLTLRSAHETPDVIKAMLDRADHRGWTAINVKGSPEFKRQAWIAASARGIKAVGHTPTEGDRLAANEERKRIGLEPPPGQTQTGGTITRVPGLAPALEPGTQASQLRTVDAPGTGNLRPGAPAPSSAAAAEPGVQPGPAVPERAVSQPLRQYLTNLGESPANVEAVVAVAAATLPSDRVYVGLVTARDYAPYEFKQDAKESPYVTLQGPTGAKTVWGVDLPRALDAAQVKTGDSIALEFRGNQPVIVPVNEKDGAGRVVGWHDETVMRNSWFAAKVDDLRAEALRPATTPTVAGAAANDSQAVALKSPDRLQTPPVSPAPTAVAEPAPSASPVAGTSLLQPPSQAPKLVSAGAAVGDAQVPSTGIKPSHKIRDIDAPAFAAFDAVLKQKNIPASLHQTLRETFGRELEARQARGETVGVKLFDASAPRAVTPKLDLPTEQRRNGPKVSR